MSDAEKVDLSPHDAQAPGPITAEHESGSWEQTKKENEAREALLKAQGAETADAGTSSASSTKTSAKASTSS